MNETIICTCKLDIVIILVILSCSCLVGLFLLLYIAHYNENVVMLTKSQSSVAPEVVILTVVILTTSSVASKVDVLGPDSIYRWHLTSIGNPIVEIRRSYDRLISTMGFPIPVRRHLYIESGPWSFNARLCFVLVCSRSIPAKGHTYITLTSWLAWWRLKSPASRLFVQAQIKENIKALCHWPLWGEFTGDRWIPLTMGK